MYDLGRAKMMVCLQILLYLISAFLGYLVGRWGHYYLNVKLGNPAWIPHHWIFGVIFMIVGLILRQQAWGLLVVAFGAGHFISDLKDFLNLKFFGPDEEGEKHFWGID